MGLGLTSPVLRMTVEPQDGLCVDRFPQHEVGEGDGAEGNEIMVGADGGRSEEL